MSKKSKISIVIYIIFSVLISNIAFADENINITITQNTDSTVNISINSRKSIERVRFYTKREGEEYHLFYESHQVNSNSKNYKISRNRLSSEKETYFKIIVVDIENTEVSNEFKIERLATLPSTTPSPSSSPTTTPTQNVPTPTAPLTVKEIKLNKTSVSINVGKTAQLIATVSPSNSTNKNVTFSSSSTKIATVSSSGKITGKAAGTATITAKTSNGKKATCKVTVKSSSSSSTKPKSQKGDGYKQVITLGGRTFKLYKQYSGSYAGKHFNSVNNSRSSGTISNMGCGPSSIAIILSGYGFNKNPYDIGKLLMKNSKPSGLPSMEKEIKALGMNVKKHTYNSDYNKTYNEMKTALESGHQIVLYVGKNAPKNYWYNFTHSGYHFISILGIDSSNNKVYVGNPSVSGGWYSLSTVVKARGNTNGNMAGWIEIYK